MTYLEQAIEKSQQGDSDQAIVLLKKALGESPPDARAALLLAAEYAQRRQYEEAVIVYRQAAALEPAQGVTHFQLGLLLLTMGRVEDAKVAWKGLDSWPSAHYLQIMRAGLEHLCADRFAECLGALQQGISANREIQALNDDMQRVIARVSDLMTRAESSATTSEAKPVVEATDYLLSAYQRGAQSTTRH